MKITKFNKGILSSSLGSFWWGVIGTYYFQYIAFVGTFEVVVHRCLWTALVLLITTSLFNKWESFKKILFNKLGKSLSSSFTPLSLYLRD